MIIAERIPIVGKWIQHGPNKERGIALILSDAVGFFVPIKHLHKFKGCDLIIDETFQHLIDGLESHRRILNELESNVRRALLTYRVEKDNQVPDQNKTYRFMRDQQNPHSSGKDFYDATYRFVLTTDQAC